MYLINDLTKLNVKKNYNHCPTELTNGEHRLNIATIDGPVELKKLTTNVTVMFIMTDVFIVVNYIII